jgi:hypothetical protein
MRAMSIASVLLVTMAVPAFAGQPDNPGAGGQQIKSINQYLRENDTNLGQAIKLEREFYPDFSLGEFVQGVKEAEGGDPNPANDNGGGND